MKKILSLLASIGMISTLSVPLVSCSDNSNNAPTIKGTVSDYGNIVSFKSKITANRKKSVVDLENEFGVKINKTDFLIGNAIKISFKNGEDEKLFGSSVDKDATVEVIVNVNTSGVLRSKDDKTYTWQFFDSWNDEGKPHIKKIINNVEFTVPKTVIFNNATLNDKRDTITINGSNFNLINKDAKWSISSQPSGMIPNGESITPDLSGKTNNKITIKLSVPLENHTGFYPITCELKDIFKESASVNIDDHKFFSYAHINYDSFNEEEKGKILCVIGEDFSAIEENDIKKFKLSSEIKGDLEIGMSWDTSALVPKGNAKSNKIMYIDLDTPVLDPGKYTFSYLEHSIDFEIPAKSPVMYAPTINDQNDEVIIRGENLNIIAENSYYLTIVAIDGTLPDGEALEISPDSDANMMKVKLSAPLDKGTYQFIYNDWMNPEVDSPAFTVTESKSVIPDLSSGKILNAEMIGDDHIDLTTQNIPDGDYTSITYVNGVLTKGANENGNLMGISLIQKINEGEEVKIEIRVPAGNTITYTFKA